MGRPKKEKKMVQYTIMLDPDIIKEIKAMAKSSDLPPATFTRNLIMASMDEARMFYKVGVLRLFSGGRKQIEKIKEQFNFDNIDI